MLKPVILSCVAVVCFAGAGQNEEPEKTAERIIEHRMKEALEAPRQPVAPQELLKNHDFEQPTRKPLNGRIEGLSVLIEGEAFADQGFGETSSTVEYHYVVKNPEDSKKSVARIYIESGAAMKQSGAPAGWKASELTDAASGKRYWCWEAETEEARVAPGQEQIGFWAITDGWPEVVPAFAKPDGDSDVDEEAPLVAQVVKDAAMGNVLGAGGPRTDNKPTTLEILKSLREQIKECIAQGWISNIDQFYEPQLRDRMIGLTSSAVRSAGEQETTSQAIHALKMLLNTAKQTMEAKPRRLTSEAYSLIKVNAEFVMKRLTENAPGGAHAFGPPGSRF